MSTTDDAIETMDAAIREILVLRARVAKLEAALRFLIEDTKWKSVDKDNMEFEGRVTCYQLDRARAALKDAPSLIVKLGDMSREPKRSQRDSR